MCTSRPPFRGTSLKELGSNILNGYYLPISGFSNDIREIISKMLIVDPKRRASTDELLNSEIIQRKIKSLGSNLINIKDTNSKKVNLIKTIKLPRNMKEINLALPRNRYNQKESMMENDPYEKTKNIYMETINKLKVEKQDLNKNNIQPKKQLEIIEEKPKIIPKNNEKIKYNYLNNYDKNWNPIKKEINNKKNINTPSSNKPKGDRYKMMYKDDITIHQNENIINNNKKPVVNKVNRYGFNNKKEREKGWFKRDYPEFKYLKPKRAANCKVNYNKINYKDYCAKNNIDRKKNYHYYRENGYYNYNRAINEYKNKNYNIYKGNNNNYKGPRIVGIKP